MYACMLYVIICACMLMYKHSFTESVLQPCPYFPGFLALCAFVNDLCRFCN